MGEGGREGGRDLVAAAAVPRPVALDVVGVDVGEALAEARPREALRGDADEGVRGAGAAAVGGALGLVHAADLADGGQDLEAAVLEEGGDGLGGLARPDHGRGEELGAACEGGGLSTASHV